MEPQIKKTYDKKLKKEFQIVVPSALVDSRIESYIKKIQPDFSLKGFRKGLVPIKVIKEKYGQSIMTEESDKIISETLRKLTKDNDLKLAMSPKVDFKTFEPEKDIDLTVSFELYPDVPQIDLNKIKITKKEIEISAADTDDALEKFLKFYRNWNKQDASYKAKNGDAVKIDYVGKIDKKEFEGGAAQDYQLELGSKSFIDNFEEQLVGKKSGDEVKVKVKFPKEYHNAEYAGKAAEFDVKVHEVLTGQMPELSDEFIKNNFGLENKNKLVEALKSQVEARYIGMSRNLFKKELFDFLNKKYDFDLPVGLVEQQFESLWKEVEEELKTNPGKFKNDKESEKEKGWKREAAERMIRCGMIISDLAQKNKIEISAEELNREVGKILSSFPRDQQQTIIKNLKENHSLIDNLKGSLIEEKTIDFILSQPSLEKKKFSVKDFDKIWKKENESE